MTKVLLLISALILSGCSARSVLVNKKVDYDPETEARIRIYNVNGNSTTRIFNDASCKAIQELPNHGKSKNPFHRDNFHNGLPKRTLKNVSIGMPFTEQSAAALKRNSVWQTLSFNEEVMTAGVPTVVRGSYFFATNSKTRSTTSSCEIFAEFTPRKGKDYELKYSLENGYCRMYINELETETNSADPTIKAKVGKEITYRKCDI